MKDRITRILIACVFVAIAPWSALAFFGGCANTAPQVKSTQIKASQSHVLECAQNALISKGYTPEAGGVGSGFIRATKQVSGMASAVLVNQRYTDVVTVTAVKANGGTKLQVTGETRAQNVVNTRFANQGSTTNVSTSDTATSDVEAILSQCGDGPRTEADDVEDLVENNEEEDDGSNR